MTGTAAELTPIREVDDLTVGDGTRGPITAEIQAIFEDALHGRSERYAEWLDRVPARRLMSLDVIVYDTTLRDGMQGEGMSLSVEEKVRVARILDELGVPMIEAGFPTSNPKELELFERLREAGLSADICAFGMTRRRGVAAEEDAGAARARRVLDAGLDARRQDLGPAPGEGRARRPRREPADDRRVGRVPRRRRQARDLRRRALLRRLPRRPGLRDRVPARRAARRAPRT